MVDVRNEMPEMWNSNVDAMKTSVCSFWEGQTKLLDNMQEFTLGWFDRRHQGTQAALSATQKMCQARNPIEAMACYQEWVTGAAARMIDDGVAYQKLMSSAASNITPPRVEAVYKANEQKTPFQAAWAAA
jgi:Phasin protein